MTRKLLARAGFIGEPGSAVAGLAGHGAIVSSSIGRSFAKPIVSRGPDTAIAADGGGVAASRVLPALYALCSSGVPSAL